MWFAMKTPLFIVSLAVTSLLPSIALANGLGPADGFTIFTIESYQANNTDCTGRVAVGGPATYNNFGVGSALSNSDGSRDDLIVAGTLSWNNGQSFNGNVQVDGSANMNNVGLPNGSLGDSVAIDFEDAEMKLQALSDELYEEEANGTVSNSWGQLSMVGTDPNMNIFYLRQSDLNPLWGMSITVPEGSSVLVNVNHHAMQLMNFQPTLSGCDATDILFNFPIANSVQLNSIGWKGTILAPKANIQFNNGQIDGALICRTIQGNGESHHAPFEGMLPSDSEDEIDEEDDRDCLCCCHNSCDEPSGNDDSDNDADSNPDDDGRGDGNSNRGRGNSNGNRDNDGGHCQCTCDCDKPFGIVLYD
jgi:choice-of-anchor A domain-containing protein